jgi:hypothetical protein
MAQRSEPGNAAMDPDPLEIRRLLDTSTIMVFMATLRRKSGPIDIVAGRYIDRLERRNGKWGIVTRACLVEWNGELAPAQTAIDPELFLHGTWDRTDFSYHRPLHLSRPRRDLTGS